MMPISRFSSLFVAVAMVGGCSYDGGDIGDPIHRKFHWRSFVEGEDVAAACEAGAPDRSRLVYNAVWGEQVRIYEWDSARRSLRIRVIGHGDLRDMALLDPLAAWRAEEVSVSLDPAAYDGLDKALAGSGAFGPPAVGLELPSNAYYWASAVCHGGHFTFTGWRYPSESFDKATFPAALFALDPGREGVRHAAPIPLDVVAEYDRNRGAIRDFTIKVGPAAQGK